MTFNLSTASVRGILLDIEGTTTPINFVFETLFPFAGTHVKNYLSRNSLREEVRQDIARLNQEHQADVTQGNTPPPWMDEPPDAPLDAVVAYVHWLMDQDRKSTGLKSLQGKIWQEGYATGELKGQVFADVPPALERWHRQGLNVSIFSSGSVLAQKLVFGNSEAGDLTKYLSGYYDTTTGPKAVAESYRHIAGAMGLAPAEILFISDVTAELDAAQSAGMLTLLSIRPGNRPPVSAHHHLNITTFAEIVEF